MKLILLVISLSLLVCSQAQDLTLTTSLDTSQIRIGEQTTFRITAYDVRDVSAIKWPEIKDTLHKNIEVIEVLPVDTLRKEFDVWELQLPVTITSWDSGYYAIRPLKVGYGEKDYETEALLFSVNTVKVDTTAAPMDIKPIYQEPFSIKDWFRQYWPYLLALLVAILVIFFILRKKRKGSVDVFGPAPIPVIPPHEKAFSRLKALQANESYAQENKKRYYSELTETLRAYLEDRYRVKALEQTSAEILEGVRYIGLDSSSMDYLRSLLVTADMVKFAKEKPSTTIAQNHLQLAFEFIERTQKVEEKISEENE